MRRLGLVLAFGVLAAGTAAQAEVVSVTGSSSGLVSLDGQQTFNAPGTFSQGTNGATVSPSFDLTNPASVSFEAGTAASGQFVTSISTSSVDITIKNTGPSAVAPSLLSTITAAGLGFYLADRTGGCGGNIYSGCAQTTGGETFADLTPQQTNLGTLVALAGFDFKVMADGVEVYDFTGSQSLTVGADGKVHVNDLVLSANNVLGGLTPLALGGLGSASGYAWDASQVLIPLGDLLGAGDSRLITYSSTVTTFSRSECVGASDVCLVAYSAFGDPVGRGGDVENLNFGGPHGGFGAFSQLGGIHGVGFTDQVFNRPTFENGLLTFQEAGPGIPEPATWATLILGFGLAGSALRRRRALAAI